MTQHQTAELLERATAHLRPSSDLVTAGVARGRRRRRRHLVGTAAASVAVLGLVGTGLSLAGPVGDGAAHGTRVADRPSEPVSQELTPAVGSSTRRFGMDPGKTGWALGSLLVGDVTKRRSWTDQRDDYRGGSVLLDGAQVTILLERTTLSRCGEQPPGAACDSLGDGFLSTLSYEEPAPGGGPTGVLTNTVTYYTADHFAVTATAYNAAAEKDSAPFLDAPILSVEQLEALVQDPVWFDDQQ